MDKLVRVGKEEMEELTDFLAGFGDNHYNVAPVGWRETTYDEYAAKRMYSPLYFEYKQMYRDQNGVAFGRTYIPAMLEYFHDKTGMAVEHRYLSGGKYEAHYYAFGCQHQYSTRNVGNCLTEYTCDVCGYKQVIDSSD